jgi:hypothetical protein
MKQPLLRLAVAALTVAATLAAPAVARAAPAAPGDDGTRVWSARPADSGGRPDRRTHYTLQAAPKDTVNEQVLVTNSSKVAATFRIYATDAFNTPDGAYDLLAEEKKPVDVGAWVSFPAPTVTIPAGASVPVPFRIAVPAGATPGDHAGGVVVSVTSGTEVKLDTRVAVRLYLRIAGFLRPTLAVQGVQATYRGVGNPFGKGGVDVTYTVVNTGNIRLRGHPKASASSSWFGTAYGRVTPPDLPELLPGQRATFHAQLDGVFPAGPVDVKVELQPFPDPEQPVGQKIAAASATATIWALSWRLVLLIVVVLLLIAGVVAYLLVRRARTRAAERERAAAARRHERKLARKGAAE